MHKLFFIFVTLVSNWVFAETNYCGLNEQAKELAELIISSKMQQRTELNCNVLLSQAAFEKAKTMAQANTISHNINNITPNEHLKKHGIQLPFSYDYLGNQVEAVSGGMTTATESFKYFMSSRDHKEHLLGENDFYQQQKHIGVGFFHDESKKHEYYWVVYITSFRSNDDKIVKPLSITFKVVKEQQKKKRFKRGDTLSKKVRKKQP